VFVRSVSWENGRVIKSIGAPASGEGSEPGLGFRARWRRRGERDVRIIDICGADERARQPTGGKGPRITSGGPYSPRRSDQTCVHPVLSALAGLLARGENRQELGAKRRGKKKERDEICRCGRHNSSWILLRVSRSLTLTLSLSLSQF